LQVILAAFASFLFFSSDGSLADGPASPASKSPGSAPMTVHRLFFSYRENCRFDSEAGTGSMTGSEMGAGHG